MRDKIRVLILSALPVAAALTTHLYYQTKIDKFTMETISKGALIGHQSWRMGFEQGREQGRQEERMNRLSHNHPE